MIDADIKDLDVCLKCRRVFCDQYAANEPCPGFELADPTELRLREAGMEYLDEEDFRN